MIKSRIPDELDHVGQALWLVMHKQAVTVQHRPQHHHRTIPLHINGHDLVLLSCIFSSIPAELGFLPLVALSCGVKERAVHLISMLGKLVLELCFSALSKLGNQLLWSVRNSLTMGLVPAGSVHKSALPKCVSVG